MKKSQTRGITLIALVITIVVLLILAGITIGTLTSDNGIIKEAQSSKESAERVALEEQIEAAILIAEQKYENPTLDQVIAEIKKIKTVEEVDRETGDITSNLGYVITGKLDKHIGITATASAINALIGQVVAYEDGSGEVDSWRVFYASDTEMFLIATNTVASGTAFGSSNGIPLRKTGASEDYRGAEDVFNIEYGKTYNQLWHNTESTDTENRSKATAYLCDPANWTKYIGSNAPSGTYAVGGPTKELFVKSWNASKPQTNVQEVSLVEADVSKTGYAYDKPDYLNDYSISKTILPATEGGTDGLYNNGTGYWLGSPGGSFSTNGMCFVSNSGSVNGDGCVSGALYYSSKPGVRPLVSIPMSKVKLEQIGEGIYAIKIY